jgi:hypothetical protein
VSGQDAELRIRPVLTGAGEFAQQLATVTNVVNNVYNKTDNSVNHLNQTSNRFYFQHNQQARQAEVFVSRVDTAYTRFQSTAAAAGNTVGQTFRNLFSLQTAIAGFVVAGAGRSFLDATLGTQDQRARARLQLQGILQDENEVNAALARAQGLTREIASIDYTQATRGIAQTMGIADGSVERAGELVRLAQALATVQPDQGFEGALFALRELQTGDAMSLRERFSLLVPSRAEALALARESGQTLNQYYFDELNRQLDTKYAGGRAGGGVDFLLNLDNATLSGQFAMLRTSVADVFADIGAEAYAELTGENGIASVQARLDALRLNPEFRNDVRHFARWFAESARSAVDIAQNLPGAILNLREFLQDYGRPLAMGGGLLALNSVTGGALTRGAGALVGRGARFLSANDGAGGSVIPRMLESLAGGSNGAQGLPDAAAMPVRVVNWSDAGGGLPGGSGGAPGSPAGAPSNPGAGLTPAGLARAGMENPLSLLERFRAFGLAGSVSTLGATVSGLTLAAGGLTAGSLALLAQLGFVGSLNDSMQGTLRLLESEAEAARELRERQAQVFVQTTASYQTALTRSQAQDAGPLGAADARRNQLREFLQAEVAPLLFTGQLDRNSPRSAATLAPLLNSARAGILSTLGGPDAIYTGAANQSALMDEVNAFLASQGLRFNVQQGAPLSSGTFESGVFTKDLDAERSRLERAYSALYDTQGAPRNAAAEQVIANLQASGELDNLISERNRLNRVSESSAAAAAILNSERGAAPSRPVTFQPGAVTITVTSAGGLLDAGAVNQLQDQVERMFVQAAQQSALKE